MDFYRRPGLSVGVQRVCSGQRLNRSLYLVSLLFVILESYTIFSL